MNTQTRVHILVPSGHYTYDGFPICADCGFSSLMWVHDLPERSEEQREVEARRIGEEP